jgi:thioredoxin 1
MSKFETLVNGSTPVLVDFFAEWCGPCKMMPPILKELKTKMNEKVRIIKIDVDKNSSLSQKFQVQGVPTLILFKKGEIVWRQSGVIPAHQLEAIIQSHL